MFNLHHPTLRFMAVPVFTNIHSLLPLLINSVVNHATRFMSIFIQPRASSWDCQRKHLAENNALKYNQDELGILWGSVIKFRIKFPGDITLAIKPLSKQIVSLTLIYTEF